jgi:hypothetical protein
LRAAKLLVHGTKIVISAWKNSFLDVKYLL